MRYATKIRVSHNYMHETALAWTTLLDIFLKYVKKINI